MFFRQRPNSDASISYLFRCAGKGKSIAVDVLAGDESCFLEEAQRVGAPLTLVVDTHLHADHRSGGRVLATMANVPYALHASATDSVMFPFRALHDGEQLEVGNVVVDVLHTPGHTLESVCLLVTDRRRGDAPWFVLTGDTLFVGAVGRPDLAGREREMAATLYDSLHEKLLSLPDDIEVFPGHQAGSACGVGLSGKPSSTLGFEKRWNRLLSASRKEFVEELTQTLSPPPAGMVEFLHFNTGRAA